MNQASQKPHATPPGIQDAPEAVMSTMRADGKRIWLRPRVSLGKFLTARRAAAYFLMVLFLALPFGHMLINAFGGHAKQFVLLDIPARRFTLFGHTFLPTDTAILALFLLTVFVGIFLFTALLGRLWCGWACPQTVYMEFLFRPLQRLFEGTAGKGGPAKKTIADWRKPAYFLCVLLVSLIPAHTFVAYFVPAENLLAWMRGNPLAHPMAFFVMLIATLAMLFDFGYFREQLCLIACPYGRFQSVLLDKWSLIVSYDRRRGEPRGKMRDVSLPVIADEPKKGDCIDCHLCVTTCPTGIDIRNGLQMECVSCTQCIDACDAVMEKIGRPKGLIRYSSQAAIAGEKSKLLRPRLIFYPAILAVLITALTLLFLSKGEIDVSVLRTAGAAFVRLEDGRVGNPLKIKLVNRTENAATYRIAAIAPAGTSLDGQTEVAVDGGGTQTIGVMAQTDRAAFRDGVCELRLRITAVAAEGEKQLKEVGAVLIGPMDLVKGGGS